MKTQWWKEPKDNVASSIFSTVKFLKEQQESVSESNLKAVRLYGNADILGLSAMTYTIPGNPLKRSNDSLKFNICKSIVDTVCNKISKNKPKPYFLTDISKPNAWGMQEKAKKLNLFVEGLFYKTGMYEMGPKIFRDACVFDTGGFMKIFREGKEIKIERVVCDEIKIDDIESFYGSPRQMHQVRLIDRDALLDAFPSKKNLILNAKSAKDEGRNPSATTADQVEVIESWRLPVSKDSKDGKHVIALSNGSLVDEPYKKDYFPFVWMKWSEPLFGFRGQSLISELAGIQYEMNRLLKTIQQILRLSVPKMMIEKGSKVAVQQLNNEIGSVLEYTGIKPSVEFTQIVPPDLFSQLERLYARAYEIAGISQLSAQSLKPAGLNAGVAIREYNDIETERFILQGLKYEQVFIQAAKHMIELAKEIFEEEGSFQTTSINRKFIESIDWADVNLDEDSYEMQSFPTSFLPNTPSGRFEKTVELVQNGFIDMDYAKDLLDFPDLDNFMTLGNAGIQDIKRIIDLMLSKGEYQTPEPFQNLQLGIKVMQSAYLAAKAQKAPEERLELMRRWMADADAMMSQKIMEMQQTQAPAPIAQPPQAPQGELIPFPTANGAA